MEQLLVSLLSKEGLFATMFVILLAYVIKDARSREVRLMDLVKDITSRFEDLTKHYEKLTDDVDEIRNDLKDLFKKK